MDVEITVENVDTLKNVAEADMMMLSVIKNNL
jgi:hypothetical protein